MRRRLPLGLVVAALAALGASPVSPASSPAQGRSVLSLSVATRPGAASLLTLVAHLRSGSGGASVAFFVVSRQFGSPRLVPIGVAKVAANGAATLGYRPTWTGKQQFVAKLARPGANVPTATAEHSVTASTPGPLAAGANPARPLASVGHVFLDVILSVVALVWLSLIVTLALAFGRLPRLAGAGTD